MDGTNMHSLSNHTFDAVIDKGTLDALISGKNMDICEKMLRESMRILKKDGQFILITYGSPEGRKKLFESALGLTNFDYYLTRVDLSTMSTMINLMRSNLGNKPLSSITKDSEAMKKSLL
jgi:ubiquinone/menaquinone biosynthesis C-methylase UbiE